MRTPLVSHMNMAHLHKLLLRTTIRSNFNLFAFSSIQSKRNYVKSLYEDAFITGTSFLGAEADTHQLTSGNVFHNSRVEYGNRRYYKGKVKGLVFDWGGTVTDCGVFGTIYTFVDLFKEEGVEITEDEARAPMGSHRRLHIAMILEKEAVKKRWVAAKGTEPNEDDIERLYQKFVPQALSSLPKYSNVIEGVSETVNQLKKPPHSLKVGSTTGYPKQVLNNLLNAAARQGFIPDANVCLGEVPEGHPAPFMLWLCATRLAVYPIEAIVKIDDTVNGIHEGTLAGCWTVGVAKTSSYVGLNEQQLEEVSEAELNFRLKRAYDSLMDSGAHYVIDTMKDLPLVINDINRRLAAGEKP